MRFILVFAMALVFAAACSSNGPTRTEFDLSCPWIEPFIPCGDKTCNPDDYCLQTFCDAAYRHCYAAPPEGCPGGLNGPLSVLICNGVVLGCACPEGESCPAPPPCTEPLAPACVPVSARPRRGSSCDKGNLCEPFASETDPSGRYTKCYKPDVDMT